MDWLKNTGAIGSLLKKYGYALVVLLIGLLLLMLPSRSGKENSGESITVPGENIMSVEEALSDILSTVSGAGKVRVMLTVAVGEETLYQNDTSGSADRSDTVIISDADRNELGLVRQVIPPVYQGAIIVCQGADSPLVRLSIVEAVSKATGLSTDKISVLKMK